MGAAQAESARLEAEAEATAPRRHPSAKPHVPGPGASLSSRWQREAVDGFSAKKVTRKPATVSPAPWPVTLRDAGVPFYGGTFCQRACSATCGQPGDADSGTLSLTLVMPFHGTSRLSPVHQ